MNSVGRGRRRSIESPIFGPEDKLARTLRAACGWDTDQPFKSAKTVSRLSGVSHQSVANALNGDTVKPNTIIKIANGLGIDPTILLAQSKYGQYLNSDIAPIPTRFERAYAAASPEIRRAMDALIDIALDKATAAPE